MIMMPSRVGKVGNILSPIRFLYDGTSHRVSHLGIRFDLLARIAKDVFTELLWCQAQR